MILHALGYTLAIFRIDGEKSRGGVMKKVHGGVLVKNWKK
jgi:hypothetical protein